MAKITWFQLQPNNFKPARWIEFGVARRKSQSSPGAHQKSHRKPHHRFQAISSLLCTTSHRIRIIIKCPPVVTCQMRVTPTPVPPTPPILPMLIRATEPPLLMADSHHMLALQQQQLMGLGRKGKRTGRMRRQHRSSNDGGWQQPYSFENKRFGFIKVT